MNEANRIDRIQRVARRVSEIPTLSPVMSKVVEMADDPATTTSQLAHFISHDQAITLKILKLVNSAYYSLPQRIGTIDMAIVILGFEEIKNIGLSVAVIDAFKNYDTRHFFDLRHFWVHSVAVATGCKLIALELHQKVPGEAFVAGLIHDIGKLILSRHLPEEYARVIDRLRDDGGYDFEVEDELLGFTHAEAGGWLIKRWNLPDRQADAVYYHHCPEMFSGDPNMAMIVNFADILAWRAGYISGVGTTLPGLNPEVERRLQLKQDIGRKLDWEHYQDGLSEGMKRAEHYLSVLYSGD